MGIKLIEQGNNGRIIKAIIAEPLTNVSPVFLFHVNVVILMVGPRASKGDGALSI